MRVLNAESVLPHAPTPLQAIDVFLSRHEYTGELGTLALDERPWLPSLHQAFLEAAKRVSVREYVTNSRERALKACFDRLVRLYVSEESGFMGAHRIKIAGYLELGIKTGRTNSSGQTGANDGWRSRAWRKVNSMCVEAMEERMRLMVGSSRDGYTSAMLLASDLLVPDSSTYELTFDIAGSGLRYSPGDRVQLLPQNPAALVVSMIEALHLDRLRHSAVHVSEAWIQPLALNFGQDAMYVATAHTVYTLPLPSVLSAHDPAAVCVCAAQARRGARGGAHDPAPRRPAPAQCGPHQGDHVAAAPWESTRAPRGHGAES